MNIWYELDLTFREFSYAFFYIVILSQNAVQSIKPIGKSLSGMGRELEIVEQATSSGELHEKLLKAEETKVEIEAILLKRVSIFVCSTSSLNLKPIFVENI